MLTGDAERTARAVAAEVGIERVLAEVLPEDKARRSTAAGRGRVVAMVGDGINDAPALAHGRRRHRDRHRHGRRDRGGRRDADAAATSHGVVDGGPPLPPHDATIRENLFWAFGYNTLGIPVAAGVLYPLVGDALGVPFHPAIAAAAMAMSSVSVVTNSLRLRSAPL